MLLDYLAKSEIPSFHMFMGPLVHQTNRDHFSASGCSSIWRGFQAFSRKRMKKWPAIWHADVAWPPSSWLDFGHGLLIFLLLQLGPFWLTETGQIWGFQTFPGEHMEGMSIDFPPLCTIFTWWNWSNSGFLGVFLRMHGSNNLKFGKLMYFDQLENWLHFGHGLLIFLLLAPLWLSETGQIWDSRPFLENTWEEWPEFWHADVSRPPSELIGFWLCSVDFPHFGAPLELVIVGVSRAYRRMPGSKCQGGSRGIFPMLCVEFCLVLF